MKISSLKISNVLSYGPLDNLDTAPDTIQFKDNINILIGANGSGKSNLLEVVNKLFFHHFNNIYDVNDNLLSNSSSGEKAIRPNDRRSNIANTVRKHFDHKSKPSVVRIVITPDKGDLRNLTFLKDNWTELKKHSITYSQEGRLFQHEFDFTKLSLTEEPITYDITLNNDSNNVTFSVNNLSSDVFSNLFYNYLLDFNLIQKIIEVCNSTHQKNWELLKNPFALISSMRQHGGFGTQLSMAPGLSDQLKSAYQSDGHNSTKNYSSTDTVFRLTSIRIGQELIKNIFKKGSEYAHKFAEESKESLLFKINEVLEKNLGFKLKLEDWNEAQYTVNLVIKDKEQRIDFNDLSSGQKSIFYLLFTIYGFNIENGLLLIDEPELHLHAAMQTKYFKLLKEVQEKANIQIVIATHSGIFIDESSVKNTFRFSKANRLSKIINPKAIAQQQKDLLKILTYTNSSRIFFADKVLLVEGDSDEYFFRFYLSNYYFPKYPKEDAIEILYIGGKTNYDKWREFLKLFEIPNYFICDLDNVKDFGLISSAGIPLQEIIEKSKNEIIGKIFEEKVKPKITKDGKALFLNIDKMIKNNFVVEESDKEEFKQLWAYLLEKQGIRRDHFIAHLQKTKNEVLLKKLMSEIEKKYNDNVFILKQGDLEFYLGITGHKESAKVIDFCNNNFSSWIEQEEKLDSTKSKLKELNQVFDKIFS
jgi:putative ATP-dependent endonuclease of OLD family